MMKETINVAKPPIADTLNSEPRNTIFPLTFILFAMNGDIPTAALMKYKEEIIFFETHSSLALTV